MITLTKEFRQSLANNDRNYSARAVIVLADNTRIQVEDDEIWSDGFSVEDSVSPDESFGALGSTVINAATLIIDNTKDRYMEYDFYNADVTMYIKKTFHAGTENERTEVVKMGTYRVDDAKYDEATITLSMLDLMEQFDRPYETQITYPATMNAIVRDACAQCLGSVSELGTLTFPHDDFVIDEPPTDSACTFREVIGWIATIAGCFARCNRDGKLEIKWFNTSALESEGGTDGGEFDGGTPYYSTGDNVDGGTFRPWSNGAEVDGGQFTDIIPLHYIGSLYSQNICVDETVITGVRIIIENKDTTSDEKTITVERGTNDYVVQIENNEFLNADNADTVITWLAQNLIGLRFRKCNVTHADDPSIEAGDVGLLFDSRQREYPILITRHAFEIGGPQTIVCGSDTPSRNSATRFTEATKSFVNSRKMLKQQKDEYDNALEQLATDIAENAHGLYAEQIADPDDPNANIYCLHDKPDLEDSDVQIRLSTVGIVVTANGTAQTPTWYGLRVNGDMITRIMNTVGINFDWGTGGTLKLGGANNTNGLLQVYNANNQKIGEWDNDGADITGKFTNTGKYSVYNHSNTSQIVGETELGVKIQGTTINFLQDGVSIAKLACYLENSAGNIKIYDNSIPAMYFNVANSLSIRTVYKDSGVTKTAIPLIVYDNQVNIPSLLSRSIDCTQTLTTRDLKVYHNLISENVYFSENGYMSHSIQGELGAANEKEVTIYGDYIELHPKNMSDATVQGWQIATINPSSIRYKHDIKPIENKTLDPHRLLDLQVVQFKWNEGLYLPYKDMEDKDIPGIIAEDVEKIYPSATIHNKEGEVESWDERRILPGMLALIQEQHKRLDEQQKEIESLKKQVNELMDAVRKLTGI